MTRNGIAPEMLAFLAQPTPPDRIHQRQGPGGRSLSYVTARYVMDKLDELGPENWQDRYEDRTEGVRGGIGILVDGEWVWKWDVGTESDIESEKGSYSDAFKRAGVKWGIARDLYPDSTTQAGRGSSAPRPVSPRPASVSLAAPGGAPEEPEWVAEQIAPNGNGSHPAVVAGGTCPMHHLAWTLKPGGISKTTGNPYGPFWACPSTERPFCKEKPSAKWSALQEMTV